MAPVDWQNAGVTPHPAPLAFSGSRLGWADLPRSVRARIGELAGAEVISETSATSGFSPGYAAVVELGDGTQVFLKAVSPEQNPDSPGLARAEAVVAGLLPPAVPAPRLLWADDDGTWVILGFEAVHGQSPRQPWEQAELRLVMGALTALADAGTPADLGLRPLQDDVAVLAAGWDLLASDPPALERAAAVAGPHGAWLLDHLDDLTGWAAGAADASVGETLVHGDLRADNVMIDPGSDRVWLIDWPHAAGAGARWFDLLAMLPSVAMQGGGEPASLFWDHPNARGADRDAVRAVLSGITAYFVHGSVQPAPPGIANLRRFQAAQGVAALEWLRTF